MVEISLPWSDDAVGDGTLSPYDNDEWSDMYRKLFQRDRTLQGPIDAYENELAVSNPAGLTIRAATGAALVDGKFYENDANVDTLLVAPVVLTRIDRVVLRKSWGAQTVRIAILAGVEGGGVPALTQTDGVTWEIPLAQVSITIASAVTLTNERENVASPLAELSEGSLVHIETLTGDNTSTELDFTAIPTTYRHLFLIGQIRIAGAVVNADVDVRFNADNGANYNEQDIVGANAAAVATAAAGGTEGNVGTYPGATATANHAGQIQAHIANYKNTDFFKTIIAQFASIPNNTIADFDAGQAVVTWLDTSAIDQITLISSSGNFIAGTEVSLYGIL